MYTQCPQCRTIFEIDEDALQSSLGIVRCGHCAERFDALRTLSDTLPTEPDASLPEHDPDALAPTLTLAVSPEAIQASRPSRRPAVGEAPATETDRPPGGVAAEAQSDEAWFDTLAGDRAHALIADAAGIPPEAIGGDTTWQVADVPVQTRFAELDIIPMAAGDSASYNGIPGTIASMSVDAEAAESEPFTDAWGLDIPVVDVTEVVPSDEPLAREEAGPLAPNGTPGEFADELDAAIDVPGPETEPDSDSWLSGNELQAGDTSPPDVNIPMEQQDEPPGDDAEPAATEPIYVPPRRRRIRRSDWLWATGCALLALGLAAQVAWASRVALVRDPATQVQALQVCARFDCRLPPIRDIAKLELLSRDVRPDPDAAGALTITATFRNNAPYRQPWPIVVVELTDLDNNVVAMRRFRPVEYMPDKARRGAGIAAGTTAAVAFEVTDPGKRAVSFHFSFD